MALVRGGADYLRACFTCGRSEAAWRMKPTDASHFVHVTFVVGK